MLSLRTSFFLQCCSLVKEIKKRNTSRQKQVETDPCTWYIKGYATIMRLNWLFCCDSVKSGNLICQTSYYYLITSFDNNDRSEYNIFISLSRLSFENMACVGMGLLYLMMNPDFLSSMVLRYGFAFGIKWISILSTQTQNIICQINSSTAFVSCLYLVWM